QEDAFAGGAAAGLFLRVAVNAREALAWLFGTQLFGIKLGLENTERLLQALDVPGKEQRIVHVAGTNGKGSVCAMIDAMTRAGGYRTGLFTSPHLVTFRERIQVNGGMISEAEVAEGLSTIRELVRDWDPHPTFFEITTALALRQFRAAACEIIVLETGMGGRLDATNAVTPVVSVITPIDFDHQKWLGDTLPEIAREKAGIIKRGVPAVSAQQQADAAEVLSARAVECSAALTFVDEEFGGALGLAGVHQRQNAALAIAACRAGNIDLDDRAIAAGLTGVSWPARFQRWDERIVIDGAHNPAGARVVAKTWRETFGGQKATLVFGALADKNAEAIYQPLSEIAASVVLPRFTGVRVMRPADLAGIVAAVSPALPCTTAGSCAEAMEFAQKRDGPVLVTGSLHLAGEVLAHLRGSPAAFEECAQ
ncbi:MAG: bifunctional folylpolyglutamate synthase/dihydrofolate synthase, partial [Verrucomicrobiota bacterium]|nr:bifunctional folylpolyglutamate synthase/dihydrofolate synthase [Verrucomicrobiota bacterium]